MKKRKVLSLLLCFCLLFEQTGFAQVAGALDISGHITTFRNSLIQDKFRPLHLRSLGYDNLQNNFRLLLDKGDLKNPKKPELETTTKVLLNYFFIGITLPNDAFWVNLRPDAEDNIIDSELALTDVGKILLEADLQLKKDTAKYTSPETPEGKEYRDKLYQKAGELFGYDNVTIPTLTRPWIVPDEIIIRETSSNAYIYKATLKVMLEQDYLKDSAVYSFDDPKLKTLNEYSSGLIRELIIPKLTKDINTSKRYSALRQVYYSLILAQWFKSRFYGKGGPYSWLIDRHDLTGLTSKSSWSKTTYFKAYQKSFKDGEYKIQQPVYTPYGQTIRSYFSGGLVCKIPKWSPPTPGVSSPIQDGPTRVIPVSGDTRYTPLPGTDKVIGINADGGSVGNPEVASIEVKELYSELYTLATANGEEPASKFCETDMGIPSHAVYAIEQGEKYDDVVIKELAKQKGVSVDDLEADFERTVTMLEERIRYSGFIQPQEDIIAQKIHEIFDHLIKVYQTQTQESPGGFHVVDANTVNAFVIRKRTDVYFYKGLHEALYDISTRMKVPLTEDMIAFIIAHELSHSLQHTSHEGLDVRDLNESVSPYLIQMIKNGEYDADMRALELMDKAGYSVFGAVDAITFLEFITGSSQAENVLSSHPYVSLRKHRLSQIIFDQKTNVFTNIKAPRVAMAGTGRMESQDVDFRYLMDKTEEELLDMAERADTITALDELMGMFIVRKRMNALKALVNEDYLKTSFLRHVYIQAVLAAVIGLGIHVMPDAVNYGNMKGAAAIYDFGIQPATKNILQPPIDRFEEKVRDVIKEINESLSHHTTDDVVAARNVLQDILSTVRRIANSLNHNDFDAFLLSPEEVRDIIPLFTKTKGTDLRGISVSSRGEVQLNQGLINNAIQDPRRLISAFFYANYLGQEPSIEFGIPTTDIHVKLQRPSYNGQEKK